MTQLPLLPNETGLRSTRTLRRTPHMHITGPATYRFIDLFAGIGGMRLGFEAAGGKCVFTSEWNAYSQKTYTANFPNDSPIRDFRRFWTLNENERKPSTSTPSPLKKPCSIRAETILRSRRRNMASSWSSHAMSATSGASSAVTSGKVSRARPENFFV